jgi:hypothetical protein
MLVGLSTEHDRSRKCSLMMHSLMIYPNAQYIQLPPRPSWNQLLPLLLFSYSSASSASSEALGRPRIEIGICRSRIPFRIN